ncbi:hypothetical protein UFOVP1601_13 [uncultured Caudovirales phage]|uniref:Uncharacterized protein n=1 Tax=uncultured Caudovirales phage TaxID=2100421 RepID=A0A6J5SV99_9CAUD|nr:hypothetical protein UFOVP1154_23 [uncultured Caudovirales phage]CAB4199957.1 hypothetical protein UFOVP1341_14 [uncultured Caudovirales phage]CAB4218347.1 hypothetical protein UFOVP1601_13 [uncultured Caudovirales phage]
MTADALLLIVAGVAAGFALGYVTAWRLARKLEQHEVVLAEWDRPFDIKAEPQWFEKRRA